MKTVGLLVFPGVEPIEAFTGIAVLSRASAKTTIISVFDSSEVLTAHNISINPQTSLSSISDSLFDLVILPGGPLLDLYDIPETQTWVFRFQLGKYCTLSRNSFSEQLLYFFTSISKSSSFGSVRNRGSSLILVFCIRSCSSSTFCSPFLPNHTIFC
ncbi:hypothetical protein RCL1_004788 [Eukaryota sp. TZLM3-RCL]